MMVTFVANDSKRVVATALRRKTSIFSANNAEIIGDGLGEKSPKPLKILPIRQFNRRIYFSKLPMRQLSSVRKYTAYTKYDNKRSYWLIFSIKGAMFLPAVMPPLGVYLAANNRWRARRECNAVHLWILYSWRIKLPIELRQLGSD